MTFNPEISFDGAVFALSAIAVVFRAGRTKEKVKEHGDRLDRHDAILTQVAQTQTSLAQNLAVVTALLDERTRKKHD